MTNNTALNKSTHVFATVATTASRRRNACGPRFRVAVRLQSPAFAQRNCIHTHPRPMR